MIQKQIDNPRTGVPETLHKTPVPEYMPENPEANPPFDHRLQLPVFPPLGKATDFNRWLFFIKQPAV
jgi:hypothetical protein